MRKIKDQKYLYIRNGVYYFRVTIPERYREFFGKSELKESLETSNLRDAIIKVCEKTAHYTSTLKSIDHEVSINDPVKGNRKIVSKAEIERIVRKWFFEQLEYVNIRHRARKVGIGEVIKEEQFIKDQLAEAFINEEPIKLYTTWQVDGIIERNHLDFAPTSEQRKYLSDLVTRGQAELAKRRIDELNGQPGTNYDIELFSREKFERDEISPKPYTITIKQLIDEYENEPKHQNWAPKTMIDYRSMHRLILEYFGPNRIANTLQREDCRNYRDMILKYPKNATKLYPDLSYQQRIDKGIKEGRVLLSAYTRNQYISRLSTILDWAVREDYIEKNSASGLTIRDGIPEDEKRDSFDISELKKMFMSTTYTGRKPGTHGAYKPGPLVVKDARYWLPLIALFHGARLNEMAQLKTSGIVCQDGVYCFSFTKQSDDQRLKNIQSRRLVPIHPEMNKLGFLKYVEKIKTAGNDRLFPELELDSYGYYSGQLSKKFSYWLKKIGIKSEINCFHSFRHTFEDALREADVTVEIQERLGGWTNSSGSNKSARKNYGRGYSVKKLYDNIKKVKYPGLDLSHLY